MRPRYEQEFRQHFFSKSFSWPIYYPEMKTQDKVETATILVIGNEILSGRTHDSNTNTIAKELKAKGIHLVEARVISDDIETIIRHIHELSNASDILITTGGIGPTHDDMTAEAIAKAFDTQVEIHDEAYQTLVNYYGSVEEMNPGRTKMASVPIGATLIDNPVSAAPGFNIGNVYVLAGVPKAMKAMLDNLLPQWQDGDIIHSISTLCITAESVIAPLLSQLQKEFPEIEIGSYPQFHQQTTRVSVVLRSTDTDLLAVAQKNLQNLLVSKQIDTLQP